MVKVLKRHSDLNLVIFEITKVKLFCIYGPSTRSQIGHRNIRWWWGGSRSYADVKESSYEDRISFRLELTPYRFLYSTTT